MSASISELRRDIEKSVSFIRTQTGATPRLGIILGTGLGGLTREIQIEKEISYDEIPGFSISTVETHHGRLIFGTLAGKSIVAMQGRLHYYEGYTMKQITFPVRVLKFLGVETLLISNACGSMNPFFRKGDVMIMDDHINLMGDNPLIGANDNELGPRFPDMSEPYSQKLITLAEDVALEKGVKLQKGVYVAVVGPNLETRAEYRFLRTIGADVVGMSTVPENIVARHMGIDVMGVSIITDECYPEALKPVDVSEIIATAAEAEPKMTAVMKGVIERL